MTHRLRMGVVGMGNAGQAFVPPIQDHPDFVLAAFVEPDEATRAAQAMRLGVPGFPDLAGMLATVRLDAVCIASPTEHHPAQALQSIAAGLHVLVEKPMAVSLDDARAMVRAAGERGVVLLVGHSHSYDMPILKMRQIVASGRLGAVRMAHNWCFTDWVYRPRRPDELSPRTGGGVTLRQGSHQFDILRLVCGGRVRSVRARVFDWDRGRPAVGAHCVFLDFEDGVSATAVYNGYGGFQSTEWVGGISEWGFPEPPEGWRVRRRGQASREGGDEPAAKRARAGKVIPERAPYHPCFGLTLVSCEGGDIRQSPTGLRLYTAEGVEDVDFPADRSPRSLVLDEFAGAILGHAAPIHDGRWGLANLEVCLAVIASSEQQKEIHLAEQCGVAM